MDSPPPFLISWNVTKRCDLKCPHCYLDAGELGGDDDMELSEAVKVIDGIASLNPSAMLILTGGEPLLRPDIHDIAAYASSKGLAVVIGTNGTLIDDEAVKMLVRAGVKGVGVSLDSVDPGRHDRFRGRPGAWGRTIGGMEVLKKNGVDFHIQFTITKENKGELPEIIDLSVKYGAKALNIFFLVCTGRGQEMTDIGPEEYEDALKFIAGAAEEFKDRIMVRARCAPHILRVASSLNPDSPLLRGATSGCIAARGYMRISPEGFATPCPYLPAWKNSPSVKNRSIKDIWENGEAFISLRSPEYKGRCGDCEYDELCGGCRARAFARSGDVMDEDPLCGYIPDKTKKAKTGGAPTWTAQAEERLKNVPSFLRGMVKKGVERYAVSKGLKEITTELMAELKGKTGR